MTTKNLRSLSKAFDKYLGSINFSVEADRAIGQFWAAHFGCSNQAREAELLEFWRAN